MRKEPSDFQLRQRFFGPTSLIALLLFFVLGLQLGGFSWRYRKQIWQAQGALVGVVAGYIIGRRSGQHRSSLGKPR